MEPNRREFIKQCAFQKFCNTVLHNEACDAHKELHRHKAREITFSDLTLEEARQLHTFDEYNAMIKNAAKFSQHLYGKAADIWISGVTVEQIAAYAETLLPNRGGIGRYPKEGHADRTHGWVHIDTRTAKSRWVS